MKETATLSILKRQMTRKEFLIYFLGVVIAISGITTLLKVLNPQQTSGFGSGSYGGKLK